MVAASSAAKFSSTLQHEQRQQHLGAATASLALILMLMLILVSSLPQLH